MLKGKGLLDYITLLSPDKYEKIQNTVELFSATKHLFN